MHVFFEYPKVCVLSYYMHTLYKKLTPSGLPLGYALRLEGQLTTARQHQYGVAVTFDEFLHNVLFLFITKIGSDVFFFTCIK